MPYELVVGDEVRQFELYAPPGWEYFVEELFSTTGRDGLPLVVMLHGGGQTVEGLKDLWPFGQIPLGPTTPLEDRFFVLIPYGSTYFQVRENPADPTSPLKDVRGWNAGYSQPLNQADDGAFILQAILTAKLWLDNRLSELGSSRKSFDTERRFLFGYSNGGMMAYRMVNQYASAFRALWVQGASYGGKAYDGFTPLIENPPFSGSADVSVFHHHGDLDETVEPGAVGNTGGLTPSKTAADLLALIQGIPAGTAPDYVRADRTLAGAMQAYRSHNGTVNPPFSDSSTEPSLDGSSTSLRREWRNAAGDPYPSVVLYRDPSMAHTGFASNPSRYFDASDVWAWFKDQAP